MDHYRVLLDVHLLLIREHTRGVPEVLLIRRRGGYGNGLWHAPSGKLNAGESIEDAVLRETREEVGVDVDASALTLVHTAHALDSGPEPRIGLFFAAQRWSGEPVNCEPAKCDGIAWFRLDDLPEVIPYPRAGILAYRNGITHSVLSGQSLPAAR